MSLIKVSHPYVILFLLLIGYIYIGIYFLTVVYQIHTLPSSFLEPWNPPRETGNIISLCRSRTDIWSSCFCFFKILPLNLINIKTDIFVNWTSRGCFSIQSYNELTKYSKKKYLFGPIHESMPGIYDSNIRHF